MSAMTTTKRFAALVAVSNAFVFIALTGLTGCGGEELIAGTFTSDVVQRNVCRQKNGEDRESCVTEDATFRLRVSIVEDDDQRVWLQGVSREGESDRRMLGTRDSEGGFLFYEETSQVNTATACAFSSSILLALRIDEDADASMVGVDDCIALIGREERRDSTNEACDDLNDPPQQITRITRRRWEPAPDCGMEE